jgi:class 3 adenylate cyclase/tetratricopeptide (TPR) repeat protein
MAGVSAAADALAPVSVRAADPVAERRVCSVLFCDLVGFTPLSETRDPEEVRELLSRYFEVARTVIGRYGGIVEKFIGDAVMAVWGTPVAAEGDAERAVRAALDVVAAVSQLGADGGVPALAARAGVVTGEVAVSLGASHEGMVAGDAVNTAARVQSEASAGTVLVDAPTRRLAASALGFEDAGEHTLKGKAMPERLWRATRVLATVGGEQRVDGLEAPLTGRDAELRLVKELFHATAERRVPRLVLASGPAGVGKSRLGWEFEKYADGLASTVLWHRGRCLSYGDGVSFWALGEIVRARFGIAEEDPADVAAAKLGDGLERFVPDPDERVYVGMRLARLLGVRFAEDSGAVLDRDELFAGWRLYFERLAATEPVVLLIEDAQYADSGLLDFVDHLIDWTRDLPVFVLMFARPELEQSRTGFGTGRNRTTLAIDPLDAASMAALVEALVPGMPPASRDVITARAQGIPLFAVETVRSLIDRDVVQPVDGVYQLVGDVGELTVPDSLHALLAARLDALDPEVRRLVADAAVLGSTFPAEALIAVSGRDEASVREALAELLQRGVLEISADRLSPERGTYRFAQDMLRQVAYETLSRRDRKARHLAVAAHLRATFPRDGEEVTDVIARHYLDALAAVPNDPDIAELREQAIDTLIRAGERGDRTGASSAAAASYATAAELTEESGTTGAAAMLWERSAEAFTRMADWAAAVENAELARRSYTEHGDLRGAARAQTATGQALRLWGKHSEAREQLTAALDVLRPDPDTDTVFAINQLASLETFSGTSEADRVTADALILGQELDVDDDLMSSLFIDRGVWLGMYGRRTQSAMYLREAARLAEQAGNHTVWGRALLNLSDLLAARDPAAGAEAARTAAVHLRRTGSRPHLMAALANLASAQLSAGDWNDAHDTLTRLVEADELEAFHDIMAYRAWLAGLRGDVATGAAVLAELHRSWATEDQQQLAVLALADAFLAAADGRPADALRHSLDVLAHAGGLSISFEYLRWAWPLAARSAHELGDLDATGELLAILDRYRPGQLSPVQRAERQLVTARLAADADEPGAADLFSAAVAALRSQSTPYHLAHGLLDHAEFLASTGDEAGESAAVTESREIARNLGCLPLLDRAAALSAREGSRRVTS